MVERSEEEEEGGGGKSRRRRRTGKIEGTGIRTRRSCDNAAGQGSEDVPMSLARQ